MTIAEIEKYVSPKVTEVEDACWKWGGYMIPVDRPNHGGYATIALKREGKWRMERLNRVLWAAFNGPIPAGYEVDHLCGNRLCANIAHLEAVPPEENRRRKVVATRAKHLAEKGHEFEEKLPSRGCVHCRNTRNRLRYTNNRKSQ